MKRLLLTSIAALFLATGAAHAQQEVPTTPQKGVYGFGLMFQCSKNITVDLRDPEDLKIIVAPSRKRQVVHIWTNKHGKVYPAFRGEECRQL